MSDHELHFSRVLDCVEVLKQYVGSLPEEHNTPLTTNLGALSNALIELQQVNGNLLSQYGDLMTAYRALETQRRRYQALFELTPDGYLITDTRTVIQEANTVAAVLLQASRDSVVGKSLTAFIADEDYQKIGRAHV